MPGDRFTLAIRIGSQVNRFSLPGRFAQPRDYLLLALDNLIFRLKVLLGIDTKA